MLKHCCCCIRLNTGVVVIGIFGCIASFVYLMSFLLIVGEFISVFTRWAAGSSCAFGFLANGLIIYGVLEHSKSCIIIYLIITGIKIITGILLGTLLLVLHPHWSTDNTYTHTTNNAVIFGGSITFAIAFVDIYFWICSMSLLIKMRKEDGEDTESTNA